MVIMTNLLLVNGKRLFFYVFIYIYIFFFCYVESVASYNQNAFIGSSVIIRAWTGMKIHL